MLTGSIAHADVSPQWGHEAFANRPTVCVTCHRAHTATTENLLRSTSGLCLTCHKSGIGADTDVTSGMYTAAVPPRHVPPWGTVGGNLLGGGFYQADTNGDGFPDPQPYAGTSQHDIGIAQVPYGSTSGISVKLECSSCHTIHHDFNHPAQYRLLRAQVGDASGLSVPWNGPWDNETQTTRSAASKYMAYTERDFSNGVPGAPIEYTRNYQAGLSAWCEGCHHVYGEPVGPYDIGDGQGPVIRYKHIVEVTLNDNARLNGLPATDLPMNDKSGNGRSSEDTISCMTCHRAHGTTATVTGFATLAKVSRGILPKGPNASMLLRMDNRGVCINCHQYLNDISAF